jgi:MoaA/NifB/PqqE/SkfB family radical SAM enzyme
MHVLRLTGACNNRCRFCMVSHEIARGVQPGLDSLKRTLAAVPAGEWVDLFGGEPTLYPDFWALLEYAAMRGHRISLATNGRLFHRRENAERLAGYPVVVRSSLHGDTAALHDGLTRVPGSFEETCAGLKNLVDCRCRLLVNIVMLRDNMPRLASITRLLAELGVKRVKYSMLIDGCKHSELVAPVDDLRNALWEAVDVALENGIYFVLEKSPLCLLPIFITQCHPESDPLMIDSCPELYIRPQICSDCLAAASCPGVEKGYSDRYGSRGLEPFADWPGQLIQTVDISVMDAYRPRCPTNLIRIVSSAAAGKGCPPNPDELWEQLRKKFPDHRLIRVF